jgi:hypothetical protein
MDRRSFVRGLFGVAAATAVLGVVTSGAEAAPLPVQKPELAPEDANRNEADYRPEVDGLPSSENAQFYYRRRRRRVFFRRRRVYYRPRYVRRRVYYRRPVYYRRRVFVRPRYYW